MSKEQCLAKLVATQIIFIIFLVPLAIYSFYEIDISVIKIGIPCVIWIWLLLESANTISNYKRITVSDEN